MIYWINIPEKEQESPEHELQVSSPFGSLCLPETQWEAFAFACKYWFHTWSLQHQDSFLLLHVEHEKCSEIICLYMSKLAWYIHWTALSYVKLFQENRQTSHCLTFCLFVFAAKSSELIPVANKEGATILPVWNHPCSLHQSVGLHSP